MMAAIPGVIAIVGVIALAYAQANDHKTQQDQINDSLNRLGRTENNQNQICDTVVFVQPFTELYHKLNIMIHSDCKFQTLLFFIVNFQVQQVARINLTPTTATTLTGTYNENILATQFRNIEDAINQITAGPCTQ